MSYILDALKRAETERERGRIPGLLTPVGPAVTDPPSASGPHASRSRLADRLWVLLVAALLVAVGVMLWAWPDAPPSAPAAVAPPVEAPPAPVTAEAPIPAPADNPASGAAAVNGGPGLVLKQSPILMPPPPPSAPPRPATRPDVTASASTQVSTDNGRTPGKTGEAVKVQRFAELTPEQRSRLPQLSVSGSSYSENPAHRLLILNGKVLHEGQEAAPGLLLERIGQGEAVFRLRDLRFSIGF